MGELEIGIGVAWRLIRVARRIARAREDESRRLAAAELQAIKAAIQRDLERILNG